MTIKTFASATEIDDVTPKGDEVNKRVVGNFHQVGDALTFLRYKPEKIKLSNRLYN